MNALRPREDDRLSGIAPLRLRLTHSGGEVRRGAALIPATGMGMADAFRLCGERQSELQWRVANMCRIAWAGSAREWQLRNDSHTLLCVRNGERVQAGRAVPIAEGDTLELALLRFQVAKGEGVFLDDARSTRIAQPAPCPTAVDLDASSTRLDHRTAFDLRDLAANQAAGGHRVPWIDTQSDPFGVLGIAGAQPRPAADVLSELLGETPRRAPPAPGTPVACRPAPVAGSPALLDELHEEFERVVRDPAQLAGRTDWEGFLATEGESAPSLDELCRQAAPYPLLRDILQPREGIDRIIEGFEPLAGSRLLDADRPEDVLGLFGPESARDARVRPPSLTRREHHALSPDSHVRIGSPRSGSAGTDDGNGRTPPP